MTDFLFTAVFPILMILAGIGDVWKLRIPNWLTLLIALAFVPAAIAAGFGWETLALHLATGFCLLVLGFAMFAAGAIGGGDAKLMAAAGLWFGWSSAAPFVIYSVFAGGALAVFVAIYASTQLELDIRGKSRLRALLDSKPSVPYGLAFTVGAILAFKDSAWMTLAAGASA